MNLPFAGLDQLSTACLVLTDKLRILYANSAAENLLSQSARHLRGLRLGETLSSSNGLNAAIERALADRVSFSEQALEIVPRGGTQRPTTVTCTVNVLDGVDGALLIELKEQDAQMRLAREERLREQGEANRELVRTLAHEIKNPLGGIRGAAQLLERVLRSDEEREYTSVIIGEADRLQALVDRLLTPHRLPQFSLVNVHDVLHKVVQLLRVEYRDGLSILCDYDVSLPDLHADAAQLQQAFLNIARNAAQAMNGKGTLRLVTRISRGLSLARRANSLALEVTIEDNGPGIPADMQEKIFHPMVTLREGGTGLGLSLAQTWIAQHDGAIHLESEPGNTRFRITLPVRPASVDAAFGGKK